MCQELIGPGVSATKVVVETRPRVYPRREKANSPRKGKSERADDPGGTGWEIVREALACPGCAGARR